MKYFVLMTHGNFASGINTSINMIVGKQDNLTAIDCYTKEDFDIEKEFSNIVNANKDKDIIFVTDILGGSVNNFILTKLEEKIHLVTGLNLPLVLELIENQDLDVKSMIDLSISNCLLNIKHCQRDNTDIIDEDF